MLPHSMSVFFPSRAAETVALKDLADLATKEMLEYVDQGAKGWRLGKDPAVAHGYVWLFRRK
jgi:hypothetical protein